MSSRNASTSQPSTPAADPIRERLSTPRHTTATRVRHAWLIALAASLAGACGGHSSGDTYAKAESSQEKCCENLAGDARTQCLAQIPKVDDPAVAKDDYNQATYACVEDHFVCDPSTGRASKESAQAQYDCIADLGQ
jgi:hypothetical protein